MTSGDPKPIKADHVAGKRAADGGPWWHGVAVISIGGRALLRDQERRTRTVVVAVTL
jgi:hypothetical protein